jgi:hypothetical protein
MNDLRPLHEAVTALRTAVTAELGDMVPPYADEVLSDLEEVTAQPKADPAKLLAAVHEAEGVMDMLPSMPAEWESVKQAALAAGLDPTR